MAISHVAALAKYDVTITEDDVRAMAGRRTDEVTRHWRQNHNLAHIPNEQLEAEVVKKVIKNIRLNGSELPGVKQIISLFEAHNTPMAVASSSAPEIIEAVLTKLSPCPAHEISVFSQVRGIWQASSRCFLTTANKLGVTAPNCIVFEDSLSGVRAAKAAGMNCVAVPEAVNMDKAGFQEADLVVPTLEDLTWKKLASLMS